MSKVLTRPLRVLIQGKDQLGKAKYANVTESGDLKVQLSGTIVVDSVEDLPSSGYMGQVALVKNGQKVFIYDGSDWSEW